jgi:hemerythrin-like domain-containing protein
MLHSSLSDNGRSIFQQALAEHESLKHLRDALRVIMSWNLEDGEEFSRKLSGVRFLSAAFQRHLEKVMELEEYDGYMSAVNESHPHLRREINALRAEHDRLRKALERFMGRLERVSPVDHTSFEEVCNELRVLMQKLDTHSERETALLQSAYSQEEGDGD